MNKGWGGGTCNVVYPRWTFSLRVKLQLTFSVIFSPTNWTSNLKYYLKASHTLSYIVSYSYICSGNLLSIYNMAKHILLGSTILLVLFILCLPLCLSIPLLTMSYFIKSCFYIFCKSFKIYWFSAIHSQVIN